MTSIALKNPESASVTSGNAAVWQVHLRYLALAASAIAAIFWRDLWAMLLTWWNVSTYNHCLLVLVILGWIVVQRKPDLAKLTPGIWPLAVIWVGGGAFAWLLGDAAGIAFARQTGLIVMFQGAIMTLLGRDVSRGLMFPLFYSLFLIPFGEELVPALQVITADLTMLFLGWSGIPAHMEGVFITTPTGYFEVAEACSGVKFLIAMIAYGALVANICFQRWSRRIAFMALCIVTPIIANGIRAFGTIYIAHHTGIEFAAGFDHVFYGWFFFAFVLFVVMASAWKFFDRRIDDPMIDAEAIRSDYASKLPLRFAFPILLTLAALPWMWSASVAASSSEVPDRIALPAVKGWDVVDYRPQFDWQPRFDGASHTLLGRYRNVATGQEADLAIAVFDRQQDGREIVGYGQGAFDPETPWSWSRDTAHPKDGSALQIIAPGPVMREVVSFYRVGDIVTGSATKVKLETIRTKLLGGQQQAAAILVSAEQRNGDNPRTAIDAFLKDMGSPKILADRMALMD